MTFAHPWFLLLLLTLPALAWWQGRPGTRPAFLYSSNELLSGLASTPTSQAGSMLLALRWLALFVLIVALARPQLVESETSIKASGVDIVIAVDLSGSMESEDFVLKGQRVNRLDIAKDTLQQFIKKRPNDRLGIVAFAGRAYVASPLTLDHEFLLANLDRLRIGMIEDSTAIGSALATCVNRLRELKSKSKIVILMTDGQNNVHKIEPLAAAEAAAALRVKVYTIGVGTRGMAPFPRQDMFGRKVYQNIQVDIDEKTLQTIADKTGGRYYRADSTDTLRKIYTDIDQLEKTEAEVKRYVHRIELFPWLVWPGLALLLLEVALGNTVLRKLP